MQKFGRFVQSKSQERFEGTDGLVLVGCGDVFLRDQALEIGEHGFRFQLLGRLFDFDEETLDVEEVDVDGVAAVGVLLEHVLKDIDGFGGRSWAKF